MATSLFPIQEERNQERENVENVENLSFTYGHAAAKLPIAQQGTSLSAVGDTNLDRGMAMVHPDVMFRSRQVCQANTIRRMLPVSSTQIHRRKAREAAREFEKRERAAMRGVNARKP